MSVLKQKEIFGLENVVYHNEGKKNHACDSNSEICDM